MARKTSFLTQVARAAAKEKRRRETETRRQQAAYTKAVREHQRLQALQLKADKAAYTAARMAETEATNAYVAEVIYEFQRILQHTLEHNDSITLEELRDVQPFPTFVIPPHLREQLREPWRAEIPQPSKLARLMPGAEQRYQQQLQQAEMQYQQAVAEYQQAVQQREQEIAGYWQQYEAYRAKYEAKQAEKNAEIDELIAAYSAGDVDAVIIYNTMVLERSEYPEDFPQNFKLAYVPDSKELVIEYELPSVEIIPTVAEYKYVKSKDDISEKARRDSEIKDLYQDMISAICLRTIHEVLEADERYKHLEVVVFNGYVNTVDRATGHDIRPYILSVRTTRERFMNINLARVDKKACLKDLGVALSARPTELQPIKPIVEFDMVDKRFIDQADLLGDLDTRPNILDLTPNEFEQLVSNLFTKLGFETKLTRSSRDGGVDSVAFDTRPIVGGKLVIQAKRYRNTVGVSAVRDLYGTMQHEGANKGILVCTSGYGPDAYEFVKDKPVELIDGPRLLYLLDQVGIQARIELPPS